MSTICLCLFALLSLENSNIFVKLQLLSLNSYWSGIQWIFVPQNNLLNVQTTVIFKKLIPTKERSVKLWILGRFTPEITNLKSGAQWLLGQFSSLPFLMPLKIFSIAHFCLVTITSKLKIKHYITIMNCHNWIINKRKANLREKS